MTTLEWLLIVAAVAGLAALAVVLVQNVVDDTAEQIAGSSARITAAQVAAEAINNDTDDNDADKRSACNRLGITYSDAFADTPRRSSLWTDRNTSDNTGGVCAIVENTVIAAVDAAAAGPACIAVNTGHSAAARGGKTFGWVNTDGSGGDPDCVMT